MHVEFILLILSLLFFVSIFADKIGYKYGVPALLLFLAVGMFFGSHGMTSLFGMSGVKINIEFAEAISTLAMCIILFTGGMETKLSDIKSVLAPGVTLATLGVLLTCVITGVLIYYIFGWINAVATVSIWLALLMAATMSSTDSASVFSVLRTNGIAGDRTEAQLTSAIGIGVRRKRPDGVCIDDDSDRRSSQLAFYCWFD